MTQDCNEPFQSFNLPQRKWLDGLPACLPTCPPAWAHSYRKLGRPIGKASELVTCFGGVALEEAFFPLDNFKNKLTLVWFSKMPACLNTDILLTYCDYNMSQYVMCKIVCSIIYFQNKMNGKNWHVTEKDRDYH